MEGNRPTNAVTLKGQTSVAYPYGKLLSDQDILKVVMDAIARRAVPLDASGVYFVLTSGDVRTKSGFCKTYCAWHSYHTVSDVKIKFAFVGEPIKCLDGCALQGDQGPNGNAGADAMATSLAHELNEAVTDPELSGWFSGKGLENADKCVFKVGATYMAPNGARANMKLGSRHWLIEHNWVNWKGGYCAKSYP